MKRLRQLSVFAFAAMLMLTPQQSFSQDVPYEVPPAEKHTIKSKFVDQTFEIHVQLPVRLKDGSERFPVLYLTDCVSTMMFDDITALMQLGGDVTRFIMVGIGYPAENWMGGMQLRSRDMTPTEFEAPQLAMPWPVPGVLKVKEGKTTGGAPEFLQFIREELMPFIDAKYPTIPDDKGYFGDSLGGLFGLYVMFNQPDTFNRYIIGSPSAWWDKEVILKQAKKFVSSGKPLNARVFIAVGALEELGAMGAKYRMVTNVYRIEKILRSANYEGLQLSTYTFPDETHTTVIAMNYIRGLQAVYDKPAMPFLQEALMKRTKKAGTKDKKN